MLEADELTLLLTQALQTRVGSQSGQLEVQLLRPWTPIKVPDQPLTLLLREMPVTGLSPQCIIRFELRARERSLGSWQTAVQLRLWREVWVARATIRRGTPLSEADLVRERRDVLPFREPLAELDNFGGSELEFCDVVPAGAPILARALRPRPVLRKGQTAEAILEEGALRISLRVEVLEEGAPGQLIRVRNPLSRRDLYARVVDAQTLRVSL
ncbi:MAG: flagellar basal body P-ring formation chaperone FlgA [Verrucomicrobiota bacterium]|nr:flagellar basal body P-ring formation chaperone FlgA [Limisphaera sp.]MDW8381520.1 flagellar basal body P-ring formation chaperone FlgA [Verrucomicrobiota bacterium]